MFIHFQKHFFDSKAHTSVTHCRSILMDIKISNYIFNFPVFLRPASNLWAYCLFLVVGSSFLKGDDPQNTSVPDTPQLLNQFSASVYCGWDSHYFTEGRDLLDGGSLIIHDLQSSWERLFGQIWYAASPDQSYDELQFMTGVTQTIEGVTIYAGYRHLQFPSDDLNDDEAAVGISVTALPTGLQIAVDAYHSFEADGFFTEVSALWQFAITESLSIKSTGIFGINQGYVGDGHDGANHLALTLGLNYKISDSISIIARLTQSWAIDREPDMPGDEQLVDFFNGGVGMQWSL